MADPLSFDSQPVKIDEDDWTPCPMVHMAPPTPADLHLVKIEFVIIIKQKGISTWMAPPSIYVTVDMQWLKQLLITSSLLEDGSLSFK